MGFTAPLQGAVFSYSILVNSGNRNKGAIQKEKTFSWMTLPVLKHLNVTDNTNRKR
jgi:hypothetical protein